MDAKCVTLTVEQTAVLLGISRNAAYQAVAHGELPAIRIGRRILLPRAAVLKMLDAAEPAKVLA